MQYIELLFNSNVCIQNETYNVKYNDKMKCFTITFRCDHADDIFIYNFIKFINYYNKKYGKMPLRIVISPCEFDDKLVVVFLESILYFIITVLGIKVSLFYNYKETIATEGFRYLPLMHINKNELFVEKFTKLDIYQHHFRKYIKYDDNILKGDKLSKLFSDIIGYIENNGVSEIESKDIAEVIIELIDNALQHGNSDVLVDIDITDSKWNKNGDASNNYYGINIIIIEFSNINIYELLKKNFSNRIGVNDRYNKLLDAYNYHKQYFSDKYCDDDFFIIASFQDRISGSNRKSFTGGRGLTKLLKSIEDKVDSSRCYVMSGNRILLLIKEYLKEGKNNFVGFNANGDFLSSIPDLGLIQKSKTYMPGVAYNLSFAIKKGD